MAISNLSALSGSGLGTNAYAYPQATPSALSAAPDTGTMSSAYSDPLSGLNAATGGSPTGLGDNMMGMILQIMSLMMSMLTQLLGGGSSGLNPQSLLATGGNAGNVGNTGNAGDAGNAGNSGGAGNAGNADAGSPSPSGTPTPSGTPNPSPTPPPSGSNPGSGVTPTSALGGANTVPDRLSSAADATKLVDQVKQSGGGTVRIQMSHDEINNPNDMAKLQAMVQEGDKQGVKVQFTFRDNDNGGGGNTLSGGQLTQAEQDESKVIKQFGNNQSFVLDTINESGQHTNDAWFQEQKALVQNAMGSGLAGNKIMVEDSEWGGGMSSGSDDSGLATYGKQLLALDPNLSASFHVYNKGDANATASDVKKEISALQGAGFSQKGQINIGEEGNANWSGSGNEFQQLSGVTDGLMQDKALFAQDGIAVLPWMDQFVNGQINHNVGQGSDGQIM